MRLDIEPNMSCNELFNSDQYFVSNNFYSHNFIPRSTDVIIGRGKKVSSHVGNRRLHRIMVSQLKNYSTAKNKDKKSEIISLIVAQIQSTNPSGTFVKEDKRSGMWVDVGAFTAREKISRMFRKLLHNKYKSSSTSRKQFHKKAKTRVLDLLLRTKKDDSAVSNWSLLMARENSFKITMTHETKEIENNSLAKDFGEASSDELDQLVEIEKLNTQDLFPEIFVSNTAKKTNCQEKESGTRHPHVNPTPKDRKEENVKFIGGNSKGLDQVKFDEMDQLEELDVTELAGSNTPFEHDLFFSNPFFL